MSVWLIHSEDEDAYWSNEDGWVDEDSATEFTSAEHQRLGPPLADNARWVERTIMECTFKVRYRDRGHTDFSAVAERLGLIIEEQVGVVEVVTHITAVDR
jgi:hypothetical protein